VLRFVKVLRSRFAVVYIALNRYLADSSTASPLQSCGGSQLLPLSVAATIPGQTLNVLPLNFPTEPRSSCIRGAGPVVSVGEALAQVSLPVAVLMPWRPFYPRVGIFNKDQVPQNESKNPTCALQRPLPCFATSDEIRCYIEMRDGNLHDGGASLCPGTYFVSVIKLAMFTLMRETLLRGI
jgi:hypothetical protein